MLGDRLREMRGEMTRRELSEACGLSVEHLKRIELGGRVPSLDALRRIGEALDLSSEQIGELALSGRGDAPHRTRHRG